MSFQKVPMLPVAWGEVFDKLTILEIKLERMSDPSKLANVRKERDAIAEVVATVAPVPEALGALVDQLREINAALWDIEDGKRACERSQTFGDAFIQLARQVYLKNDERARIKREINGVLGSGLVEEKSYAAY